MKKIIKIIFIFAFCFFLNVFLGVTVYADEEPPVVQIETEEEERSGSGAGFGEGFESDIESEENERSGSGASFGEGFESKDAFGIDGEFDNLKGNGKYLSSEYRKNYSLDIVENMDFGANFFNDFAGILFVGIRDIGFLTCSVVYHALEFNLTELLAGEISYIQRSMIEGIFNPLWQLAFLAVGIMAIKKILKRNLKGIFEDVVKVVLIIVLSVVVANYSVELLTFSGNVIKAVSSTVFVSLDDSAGVDTNDSYTAVVTANIWNNLVHIPWQTFEFGSDFYTDEDVENILSTHPDSKERKRVVREYNRIQENRGFAKGRGGERIGNMLVYYVPFLAKCVLFILLAVLNIVLQFLAIVVVILAVVVLLMCLMPFFGLKIINSWLEKFMEVHLSMFIVSLFLALILWVDRVMFRYIGRLGWLVVIVIQAVICVVLFMCREKIMQIFMKPKHSLETEVLKLSDNMGNMLIDLEEMFSHGQSRGNNYVSNNQKTTKNEEAIQEIDNSISAKKPIESDGNMINIDDTKEKKIEVDVEELEESDIRNLKNGLDDISEQRENKEPEKKTRFEKVKEKILQKNESKEKTELKSVDKKDMRMFIDELKDSIESTKEDNKEKQPQYEEKNLDFENINLSDVERFIDYDERIE